MFAILINMLTSIILIKPMNILFVKLIIALFRKIIFSLISDISNYNAINLFFEAIKIFAIYI